MAKSSGRELIIVGPESEVSLGRCKKGSAPMLAQQILDDAQRQAESLAAPLGVPARMHIARVLTAYDKDEARALLVHALQEMEQLALHYHDRQVIQREAHMLTAAVAPDMIPGLPALDEQMLRHYEFPLFRTMLNHGHADAAFDLLVHFDAWAQFPHLAVPMVLSQITDDEKKLTLLRRSVQAWRDALAGEANLVQRSRRLPGRFRFS